VKKIILIFILLFLGSCERYALPISDLTLSGKYKLALLDVTAVDQNTTRDSLYRPGSTYINPQLPPPFDSIVINRFYIHMDYSKIRLNLLNENLDLWQFGNPGEEIYYRVLNNTTYNHGYLQFDYVVNSKKNRLTFHIEEDGIESLQLQSSGQWVKGELGEKQVLTFVWTRVGP